MQPVLGKYGIDLDLAFTPSSAFALLEACAFDVLLLDMMLPELDGMAVCRAIRGSGGQYSDIPIVALTARAELTERVVALESGIDDFITKPVEMRELVARLGAVLRRRRAERGAVPRAPVADKTPWLELSQERMGARFGGYFVNLTDLEMQIVRVLLDADGSIVSRADILDRIGYAQGNDPAMIVTIIYRVRQKFRDQGLRTDFIRTLRGQGYLIEPGRGA